MTAVPVTTPSTVPTSPTAPVAPPAGTTSRHPSRALRILRVVARGLALALLVGTLGGAAARLWMRLFSVVLGHETGFSWPGTIGVVLVFTVVWVPAALAVVATRRRWRLVPLALAVLLLWYGSALNALADLPECLTSAELAGLAPLGLAFLLTPVAQGRALVRLADRDRRTP
ncbi:hypothetical protein [Actinotalea sp. Marseille-Q4924]|uniref:hypothetical protein n=1 Tax=Actinotalea sp. Marseille-Q4924 TaxID=2866571 RepID=UPI001CE44F0A|nr:hypothetical protein [Actinotalea sp. Marseille-Q4924]